MARSVAPGADKMAGAGHLGSAADSSNPAWQWQQRPSLRCQNPQKVATSPPSSEQRCEEDNIRNSFSQFNSYICHCNLTPPCLS